VRGAFVWSWKGGRDRGIIIVEVSRMLWESCRLPPDLIVSYLILSGRGRSNRDKEVPGLGMNWKQMNGQRDINMSMGTSARNPSRLWSVFHHCGARPHSRYCDCDYKCFEPSSPEPLPKAIQVIVLSQGPSKQHNSTTLQQDRWK